MFCKERHSWAFVFLGLNPQITQIQKHQPQKAQKAQNKDLTKNQRTSHYGWFLLLCFLCLFVADLFLRNLRTIHLIRFVLPSPLIFRLILCATRSA
jgi:hypothetical protein